MDRDRVPVYDAHRSIVMPTSPTGGGIVAMSLGAQVWMTAAIAIGVSTAAVFAMDDVPVRSPRKAEPSVGAVRSPPVGRRPLVLADGSPLLVRSVLPPAAPGVGFVWDEVGAPSGGRVVVVVDAARGVLSAYRDGHEIGRSPVAGAVVAPRGMLPVSSHVRVDVSPGGSSEPFSLRLSPGDASIGGGSSSGGAMAVPEAFAAHLFDAVSDGDVVSVS